METLHFCHGFIGVQFYWWMKLEKTTDLPQATDKLHLSIIEIRTHGVSSDRY
jgi:hypothetical protein